MEKREEFDMGNGYSMFTYRDKYGKKIRKIIYKGEYMQSYNGEPAYISWYANGAINIIEHRYAHKLHNGRQEPAYIRYDMNGNIQNELYYVDGDDVTEEVKVIKDRIKILYKIVTDVSDN